MPRNSRLILAVDGGQSSTLSMVATSDGTILGTGLAGPSNHVHQPGGLARLDNALRQSISAALQAAGCTADDVSHACLGMTGAVVETSTIVPQILPGAHIRVHHDMVTALAGASLAQSGVVVIAGTGSIGYRVWPSGRWPGCPRGWLGIPDRRRRQRLRYWALGASSGKPSSGSAWRTDSAYRKHPGTF